MLHAHDRSCDALFRRRSHDGGPTPVSTDCYACAQVGAPVFHSTSCEGAQWEASDGSSLLRRLRDGPGSGNAFPVHQIGPFGRVLDPRSKGVRRWNRVLVLARGLALAVDPLFFYAIAFAAGSGGIPCFYVDGGLAAVVTVVRTCVDAVHLWHVWIQLRLSYVSRESMVVGCGKLVWDARAVAFHYLRSLRGFWFDVFVILPIPQAVFWLVIPKLIAEEEIKLIMTTLLVIFLFQFLPRAYHCICLMRRMQKVTGYIFGNVWWGFGLNLIAYLIASHVAGGCWYVLSTQRVVSCLQRQCDRRRACSLSLSCAKEIPYKFWNPRGFISEMPKTPLCMEEDGPFKYGIYSQALPVISRNSLAVKILYPIYWGLLNLSSFGNELEPTSNLTEVMFSICIVLIGLILFTLLIGNIQVCLSVVVAKRKQMSLRTQDMEWWMRRRQLPSHLRQRVHHFEHQRRESMGGEDEMELIKDLPDGLRRDIKRFLCLDLIQKVSFFHNLDDLILDNICDRVYPLVFSEGEKIIREGDPVPRMVFMVAGRVKSIQRMHESAMATSILEAGSFFGDELLSWCLRRPFTDRLPHSSATFVCLEPTEAFGIAAKDLYCITDYFRHRFSNEKLKRTARYHSLTWQTWAAVNIQLAWHRHKARTRCTTLATILTRNGAGERRLCRCAAMFLSIRPQDHHLE